MKHQIIFEIGDFVTAGGFIFIILLLGTSISGLFLASPETVNLVACWFGITGSVFLAGCGIYHEKHLKEYLNRKDSRGNRESL